MNNITDVVKNLILINILIYFGTHFLMPEQSWIRLAMFYPTSEYFQPFQLVSHMFMHANPSHIFFNMFGLYMFGSPVEELWGPRRFLFFYLFTGFGALGLHLLVKYWELQHGGVSADAVNSPMLGASGAIFGVTVAYGMLFPENVIQLLLPPIPIKAKYFVFFFAALELFLGVSGYESGVAHFAHLGGALFGFLLIVYWRKFGTRL